MTDTSIGTPEQLRDPSYTPPLAKAIPLGIQHVLAMFVSNVTPAIIVAGAAGFGFGSNSPDFPELLYLIQMSMLFAGIATLLQTFTIGPGRCGLADRAGHQLRLSADHDPAGRRQGGRRPGRSFRWRDHRRSVPCLSRHRDRQDPLCPAAFGDRVGGRADRSRPGQGWHPVRRRRRARGRSAGIWQSPQLVGGVGGDPGDARPQVLHPRHAFGLRRADRPDRRLYLCDHDRHAAGREHRGELEQRGSLCPAGALPLRLRVLDRRRHRLLPDGVRLRGRDGGRRLRYHQGGCWTRSDRQGDPGCHLCRRSRQCLRRPVRRLSQHVVQPECRLDRDDRGDEPACGDLRGDLLDHLRPDPESREA